MAKHKVKIYTDGSCLGNPGPGGWAALVMTEDETFGKVFTGSHPHTTNNRMELAAAVNGLSALKEGCIVELYTDSKYVHRGITEWIVGRKQRDWQTTSRRPVRNKELWQALDSQTQRHQIEWFWVRAHNGDFYNEVVDDFARYHAEKEKGGHS
jgi:ribonuclease HI